MPPPCHVGRAVRRDALAFDPGERDARLTCKLGIGRQRAHQVAGDHVLDHLDVLPAGGRIVAVLA